MKPTGSNDRIGKLAGQEASLGHPNEVNFPVVWESGVCSENMIDMDVVTSLQSQTH